MKVSVIFILLSLTGLLSATDLSGVYEKWQTFRQSSAIQHFGIAETSRLINLHFGESFSRHDHNRKVKVVSANLMHDRLKVLIEFPEIVPDITEFPIKDESQYIKVSRPVKLPLELDNSYEVDFYGIGSVKTSDGEVINQQKEKKFATLKLLSTKLWLAHLQKTQTVRDSASPAMKTFLESKVPEFKISSSSYNEVVARLKKTFTLNGYKLIFMSGHSSPDELKRFSMHYTDVSVSELLARIAALKNLQYELGPKEVVLASAGAFKKSRTLNNKGILNLPGLEVDTKTGTVSLEAEVCLSSGILEYLVCLPNSFEHESIFLTRVKPELLHMGLILIKSRPLTRENRSGSMKKLTDKQSRLKIEVEWSQGGKTTKVALNQLLIDRSRQDKTTFATDAWFFAGSFFTDKNIYAANIHMSLISLQQHPASVIHYGEESEDPYRSRRGGFAVNDKVCPPVGTKVKLIFSAFKE